MIATMASSRLNMIAERYTGSPRTWDGKQPAAVRAPHERKATTGEAGVVWLQNTLQHRRRKRGVNGLASGAQHVDCDVGRKWLRGRRGPIGAYSYRATGSLKNCA